MRGPRWWALAALALGCTGNRTAAPTHGAPPSVADDDEVDEPDAAAPSAANPSAAGCARVPRGAVCLGAGLAGLGADTGEGRFEERPPHAVRLDAFALDRREVSTRAWGRCVAAGHCAAPACALQRSSHVAVRCVSQPEAAAFCAWRRGRLPTEAEWERAAAGLLPEHRRYVWGDNSSDSDVGHDETPEGVRDLAGGLAEWVADGGEFYPPLPRQRDAGADLGAMAEAEREEGDGAVTDDPDAAVEAEPERTDDGLYVLAAWRGDANSPWRVVRGGDEALPLGRRTTTMRRFRQPDDRLAWVGLRCAY